MSSPRLVPYTSPKLKKLDELRRQEREKYSLRPIVTLGIYTGIAFASVFVVPWIVEHPYFHNVSPFVSLTLATWLRTSPLHPSLPNTHADLPARLLFAVLLACTLTMLYVKVQLRNAKAKEVRAKRKRRRTQSQLDERQRSLLGIEVGEEDFVSQLEESQRVPSAEPPSRTQAETAEPFSLSPTPRAEMLPPMPVTKKPAVRTLSPIVRTPFGAAEIPFHSATDLPSTDEPVTDEQWLESVVHGLDDVVTETEDHVPSFFTTSPYAAYTPYTPSRYTQEPLSVYESTIYGSPNDTFSSTLMSQSFSPYYTPGARPKVTPYRISPAPRPSPKEATTRAAGNSAEAIKTLEKLGISLYAEKWTENMRKWLGTTLMRPLAAKIDDLDELLKKHDMAPYTCDHALSEVLPATLGIPPIEMPQGGQLTLEYILNQLTKPRATTSGLKPPGAFGSSPLRPQGTTSFSTTGGFGQSGQASASQINTELCQWRLSIETYLNVPDCPRDYLIDRIKHLSQDRYLAQYKWDGGESYKGMPWNPKTLPTDAHIIMHLFFAYFDAMRSAAVKSASFKPFTQRHFFSQANADKMLPLKDCGIFIYEHQKNPPHYKVVMSGKDTEVLEGRNNLFHALVLFVHHIVKEYDGFIEQMDFSTVFKDVVVK